MQVNITKRIDTSEVKRRCLVGIGALMAAPSSIGSW